MIELFLEGQISIGFRVDVLFIFNIFDLFKHWMTIIDHFELNKEILQMFWNSKLNKYKYKYSSMLITNQFDAQGISAEFGENNISIILKTARSGD